MCHARVIFGEMHIATMATMVKKALKFVPAQIGKSLKKSNDTLFVIFKVITYA